MSDRHLCKGKRTDNGEWVEGYYANCYFPNGDNSDVRTGHFIIEYPGEYHEIYTESLCQCTGFKDKNGEYTFKSDILCLRITDELMETGFSNSNLGKAVKKLNVSKVLLYLNSDTPNINLNYSVYFEIDGRLHTDEEGKVIIEAKGEDSLFPRYLIEKGAVLIGNIFDNPELLEVGE